MGDNKGETPKKSPHSHSQSQQQTPKQQQKSQTQTQGVSSSSPKDPLEEHQNQPHVIISSSSPSQSNNPKRTRYTATTGQWKILPSPKSSQQPKTVQNQMTVLPSAATDSSPISHPQTQPQAQHQQQISSSDTASSPSQSTLPSLSGSIQDTGNKPESVLNPVHHQFRKGKYVSPVWKPNEMLCLARAWRVQYQTTGSTRVSPSVDPDSGGLTTKGKTRADKDREVAEFLNRHGVKRDAKTAGTKWDNMLGEFRKVYEWERGGERETVGKSYFRLSPYERKLHRLPASFDEEVFEELAQFMGSRLRSSSSSASPQSRSCGLIPGTIVAVDDNVHRSRTIDDQFPARSKQLMIMGSGGGGDQTYYGFGGGRQSGPLMGFDQTALGDISVVVGPFPATKELRRIGKVRMAWEESVSLWAEEGENHRGRVKIQSGSLNFLNADELTYFDEAMVASTMEGFDEGPLRGFSVDRFVPGQQVKVFGRKKSIPATTSTTTTSGAEKVITQQLQLPFTEPSLRSISPWEFQDPSEYYIGCLRVPPASIPSLFDLSWYLQEPPPEDLRFPLRKDVYRDLPQGKDLFFTVSAESLDCRAVTYDILHPILRTNPSLTAASATSRDSFVGLWDDCVNQIVSKFCAAETIMVRKPSVFSSDDELQDEWPNVTGFTRGLCLWRGEETDQIREGQIEPSNSIIAKLLWTYGDLPYILGYYAIGFSITFCALSRGPERIIRTDIHTLDLSSPSDRLKAVVPCYRIAGLLGLLADRCFNGTSLPKTLVYSDFERFESNGNSSEATPNSVTRFYANKRKWTAAKEIYDFLDHRIPHAELLTRSSERDLSLSFKPRGIRSPPSKPASSDQLVEALKCVTKALVALHDLSFMHRDLKWEKISRRVNERGECEWFVSGFEESVGSPQIYPYRHNLGSHAPEMERGLHGVKVDVWGVGNMVREWLSGAGATSAPAAKMLRELEKRCLEQNPEARPTAADCYHHLLQLQSTHHHLHASV